MRTKKIDFLNLRVGFGAVVPDGPALDPDTGFLQSDPDQIEARIRVNSIRIRNPAYKTLGKIEILFFSCVFESRVVEIAPDQE